MPAADIEKYFKGKKITLMGLGLLGRGVGDAEFFASAGANLIVTDLKTEAELEPSLERLKNFSNITYHLGGHRLSDFEGRDLIVRAPNVPLDSLFLAQARKLGIPVAMDASLFTQLSDTTIIGITGTRGKSTVTHLLYEILKSAGKNPYLGGNERGVSTLQLLSKVKRGDIVVLELDSWQLQGFEEAAMSPHISVWTNFMPDHMNYYKGDMDRYFQDKAAIARFQKKGDYFITTPDIKKRLEARFEALAGSSITNATLPDEWEISLEGEHNRRNAAYARAAAQCLSIPDDIIKKTLKEFSGLPNRLQYLGEKRGIAFYNDSNATTPDATLVALKTLREKHRPIVLIAGGSDKELTFNELASEIQKTVKNLVLFKGGATEKLQKELPEEFPATVVSTMDEAIEAALKVAASGDVILLSPAATSFGIFKNEYDRGEQFERVVGKLK